MSVYSHSGPFSPRTIKGSCCWSTTGTRYPCEMVRKRAGNVIAAANQACWNLFPAVYRRAWQIHRGMKTVLGQRRCSSMEREPWVIDVPAGACMVVRGSPRPGHSIATLQRDASGFWTPSVLLPAAPTHTTCPAGESTGHSVTIDDTQNRF